MTQEINITVLPEQAADNNSILREIHRNKNIKIKNVRSFQIIRRSIDARKKPVKINLGLLVSDEDKIPNIEIQYRDYKKIPKEAPDLIIVGAGPSGLFAALKAIELGMRPIVLERGEDVDTRRKDIALIGKARSIKNDSNFCFGEGGAGAFSDGKLFTRSKKRGNVREVLEILCQFGAKEDLLVNAHPHIGSDRLPGIIKNIRNKIIECGGEVRFGSKVTGIIIRSNKARGVIVNEKELIEGPVFLATGHSARDIYKMLHSANVKLEPKGLAIGVRLEHPQEIIDKMQYHSEDGRGQWLPPAEYSFVNQADGRGVYTFCMCPGGVIVPAVNSDKQIVVNGMSASARSGKWANSGYVVELHPGDIEGYDSYGVFEMLKLQENLETKFAEEAPEKLNAPAQRIEDFIENKLSKNLPKTSYFPGIHPSDFNILFPEEISERLKTGLQEIGKKNKSFLKEGIMIGLESRTSSPVRIPRDSEKLHHIEIKDLYPMGEGAGYAGGIVSSAIDGMRCVEAYHNQR